MNTEHEISGVRIVAEEGGARRDNSPFPERESPWSRTTAIDGYTEFTSGLMARDTDRESNERDVSGRAQERDYRWPVDREKGFEKTSMIFGTDVRLTAIDYESSLEPRPEVKKREPRG